MMLRATTVGFLCLALGCSALADEASIAKFKGVGEAKTKAFAAPDNWVVRWKAEESIAFIFVVNAATKKREVVITGNPYLRREGKKFIEKGGDYYLQVATASGPWILTVEKHKFEDE